MSNIHLLTTADNTVDLHSRNDFKRLSAAVQHDKFRKHSLVDSPEAADIILFVGSNHEDYRDVRSHPFLSQYREKCFLYHSNDFVIPFLPGVYVNITKRWYSPRRTRTGFYMKVFDMDFITHVPSFEDCEYLFCFIGSSRTHPVRSRVVALKHPRAYIEDTSAPVPREEKQKMFFMVDYGQTANDHYGSILARSKFGLCPRGYACSSWRLFETMKAGRVPVIISDQWIAPVGPAWESFSIQVNEKDAARIPKLLEQLEPKAEAMGLLARAAWEEWFSREVCFHRLAEWCLDLKHQKKRQVIDDVTPYFQLLRPYFFRHVLLSNIKRGTLNRMSRVRRLFE